MVSRKELGREASERGKEEIACAESEPDRWIPYRGNTRVHLCVKREGWEIEGAIVHKDLDGDANSLRRE